MKQGDDNCNSVCAKKKKMSPVQNEKKTDDDDFNTITEGDLKKKMSVLSRLDMYHTKVLMYHTMVLMVRLTKVRC
jgi:hypothetical protein